jgi:hypothetical protein
MSSAFQQQITDFQHWRDQLSHTIAEYRDWLDTTNTSDALQDLRLYDMSETLRKDHLILAFIAEFSRGKTETINALFFSDFNQRLLPCEAGRTTMCPTEIFWDEREEPCIKLLPIATRKRDDSLAYLKSNPNEWTKIRLDTSSATSMKDAFQALVQQKEVSLDEARDLGLWNDADISMAQSLQAKGTVDIPVWRHALVNFPHPLLKSGLVILDTPGLNTLGTEPELTLSIIPNAHAVVFLLATDTGVTKSDMHIWTQYISNRASRKLAVLNKVDILWDEMKSTTEVDAMIQSQVTTTAHQLGLPPSSVLAISAQKALLAKIRKDPALLERSGIGKVEQLLAERVIADKHQILSHTIVNEVCAMLKSSRKVAQQRLDNVRAQLAELQGLRGQNRNAIQGLLAKVTEDRKLYEASIVTFNQGNQKISSLGEVLLNQLSLQHLDVFIQQSRQEIGDSWTTVGLNRSMKGLIKQTSGLADEIAQQSHHIKKWADELYQLFHKRHGFEARKPPLLEIGNFTKNMHALEKITSEFCANPVNVMTEKHFLIRKFFLSLGGRAQAIFEQTHKDSQLWLQNVLGPLKLQISEHKTALEKRAEALMQVHDNLHALETNMAQLENELATLHNQSAALDQMLLRLMKAAKPAPAPATQETATTV